MNDETLDTVETEDVEGYYPEAFDDGDSESLSWMMNRARVQQAQAQARARAAALARARARSPYRAQAPAGARARTYMPSASGGPASAPQVRAAFQRAGTDIQKNWTALRNLDLNNRVQSEMVSEALKAQRTQIGRSEYALAASQVVDELKAQIPEIDSSPFWKAVLPVAPLLLLKPQKRGSGLESLVLDPRVMGCVVAGAVALYQGKGKSVQNVTITPPALEIAVSGENTLTAVARDGNGNMVEGRAFTWYSDKTYVATVDAQGKVKAIGPGEATIWAQETKTARSASAKVTVAGSSSGRTGIASVVIDKDSQLQLSSGATSQLVASALDFAGKPIPGMNFTWVALDSAKATVTGAGNVGNVTAGNQTGTARILAIETTSGKTAEVQVTVQ